MRAQQQLGFLAAQCAGLIIQGGFVNGVISALVGAITANYFAAGDYDVLHPQSLEFV
jgi:hypothetical protein